MLKFFKNFRKEKEKPEVPEDKYGLKHFRLANIEDELSWIMKPTKQVILTNVAECKDLTFLKVLEKMKGLGNYGWDCVLSFEFMNAVIKAIEDNKSEADITKIFSIDFFDSHRHPCTQERIRKHLLNSCFDVVNETSSCLFLKFKI